MKTQIKYVKIIVLFFLFSCQNEAPKEMPTRPVTKQATTEPLITYSDSINVGFNVELKHPKNVKISRIQNGYVISDSIYDEESYDEKNFFMSIWMNVDESIESLIEQRKTVIAFDSVGTPTEYKVNNKDATQIIFYKDKKVCNKLIFFVENKTLFEVRINEKFEEMERILHSFEVK